RRKDAQNRGLRSVLLSRHRDSRLWHTSPNKVDQDCRERPYRKQDAPCWIGRQQREQSSLQENRSGPSDGIGSRIKAHGTAAIARADDFREGNGCNGSLAAIAQAQKSASQCELDCILGES